MRFFLPVVTGSCPLYSPTYRLSVYPLYRWLLVLRGGAETDFSEQVERREYLDATITSARR